MANILTIPESGIFFDGNTAGTDVTPILTGDASGVAIQYDGYAGIEINSSATGVDYLDRFSVEGANGRLFGVSDAVTGTVFSVNDAAGLPIIEVESTSNHDKITIGEYGTDALVVSGDSVGIGTTSPVSKLHAYTATTGSRTTAIDVLTLETEHTSAIEFDGFGQGLAFRGSTYNNTTQRTIGRILHQINDDSNNTTRGTSMSFQTLDTATATSPTTKLHIDYDGNVGIGTTSPESKLHVQGALLLQVNASDQNSSEDSTTNPSTTTPEFMRIGQTGTYSDGRYTHEWVKLDRVGNLPLYLRQSKGTANSFENIARFGEHSYSTHRFEVFGTIAASGATIKGNTFINDSYLKITAAAPNLIFTVPSGGLDSRIYNDGSGNFIIGHGTNSDTPTERLRITSAGNVGIGTTNPAVDLQIGDGTVEKTLRVFHSDNTYTQISGYGLFMSRGSSYIRPTADNSKGLYIGSSNYQWNLVAQDATNHTFSTNGSESVRITSAGNVGIGTTSPSDRLHIKNGDSSSENTRCDIRVENGFGYSEFGTLSGYARIQSNGTEAAALRRSLSLFYTDQAIFGAHLGASDTGDGVLTINGGGASAGEAYLKLTRNNVAGFILNHAATNIQVRGTTDLPMSFWTNDSQKMTILSSGNVGIGTTSPATKLHIVTSDVGVSTVYADVAIEAVDAQLDLTSSSSGSWGSAINFVEGASTSANTDVWSIARQTTGGSGDSSLRFNFGTSNQHSNDSKITFTSTGRVGIGTTSPQQKLHVEGNIYLGPNNTNNFIHSGANLGIQADGEVKIVTDVNDTSGVGGTDIIFGYGSSTDTDSNQDFTESELGTYPRVEVMRIDTSANRIGILDSTPSYTLDVNGTLRATGAATFDSNVTVTGDLTVNGTTTTINSTTVQVDDKNIELGTVATPTDTTADGGGITLKGATDKTINWYNATDAWTFSDRIAIPYGNESAPSLTFSSSTNTGIYGASTFLRLVVGGVWKASIASNGVTSNGFIKEGGSSSEFLKANGSVDSNTYLTTSGKAADSNLLDGIDSTRFIYGGNATGTTSISGSAFNPTGSLKSGFYRVAGTSSTIPNATSVNFVLHTSYDTVGNKAGFDLAVNDSQTSKIYFRPATGGGRGSWQTIFTDQNSSGITTVGTITSGEWNGSVIASAYLDADTAHLSGTQTFSGAKTFSSGLNISVSTSNTQLKLKRTGTATGEFNIYTNNDTLFFNNVGQSSFPMVIDEDGNVGIGTTNPIYKLETIGSGYFGGVLTTKNTGDSSEVKLVPSGGSPYIQFLRTGTTDWRIKSGGNGSYQILDTSIGGTSVMTVQANGNVGIGDTTPSYKLDVNGTLRATSAAYFNNDVVVTNNLTLTGANKPTFTTPDDTVYTPSHNWVTATPFNAAWHDLIAFDRNYTTSQEISTDGSTFSSDTLELGLFDQKDKANYTVIGSGERAVRWTWTGVAYNLARYFYIAATYSNPTPSCTVKIETSSDGSTWTEIHSSSGISFSASNRFYHVDPYVGNGGHNYVRLTIDKGNTDTKIVRLSGIKMLTQRLGDQGKGREDELPFYYDKNQNIGIGVVTPTAKLHIDDNASTGTGLLVTGGGIGAPLAKFTRDVGGSGSIEINSNGSDPQIQFASSANTFALGTNASTFEICDNNVLGTNTRLSIDSSGKVGIGTTTPNKNLTVTYSNSSTDRNNSLSGAGVGSGLLINNTSSANGSYANLDFRSGSADARILYSYNGTGNSGDFHFITDNTASFGTKLFIGDSGNVGIGTTGPNALLNVQGDSDPTILINAVTGNSANSGKLAFAESDGGAHQAWMKYDGSANRLEIGTAEVSQAFVVNRTNGNVGIGTTSPTAPLDVLGVRAGRDWSIANRATIRLDSNGTGSPSDILFGHTAAANQSSWTGAYWAISSRGSSASNKFYFYRASGNPSNATEAVIMAFDPNGNVGIGTTSPTGHQSSNETVLHIADSNVASLNLDSTATNGDCYVLSSTGSGDFRIFNDDTNTTVLNIDDAGNVGIGTTSPSYKLDVAASGGIRAGGKTTYTKNFPSGLDTSGELVAEITTGYNGASALFEFTCFGGNAGCYQKVVWSLYNASGTWYASNPINEGTNHFDVAYSSGEFTFKTRSGTQAYQPRVIVEAAGDSIDNSYA